MEYYNLFLELYDKIYSFILQFSLIYTEINLSITISNKITSPQQNGDVAGTKVRMNVLYEENTDLKVRLKEMETENKAFENVLMELKSPCYFSCFNV